MIERAELRPGYVIPRVIKGCWQLAGGHGAFERVEAIEAMRAFASAGLNTLDCADIYTGVEALIGDYAAAGGRPQVHTKLVPDLDRLESFTANDAEAVVDRSLQRLRAERLDLLQFFWWDMSRGDPIGVMSGLKALQAKGKIAHLGTTNFSETDQAKFKAAGLDLVSAQVQYSLLDARPALGFTQWCAENGVQLLCYGSLAGGFLTEAWLGADDPGYEFGNRSLIKYRLIIDEFGGWGLFQELMQVLNGIAGRHGVALSTVAARWVLEQPQVAAVIIGARTARHLDRTLEVFRLKLDAQDLSVIADLLARRQGPNGPVYGLEGDRRGRHGRIMKYNLQN